MTNKDFILKLIKYSCFGLLLFSVFVLSFACGFYYRDSGHTMQVNVQSVNLKVADIVSNDFQFDSSLIDLPVIAFSSQNLGSTVVSSNLVPSILALSFRYNHFVDNTWSLTVTGHDFLFSTGDNYSSITNLYLPTFQSIFNSSNLSSSWSGFFWSFNYTDINNSGSTGYVPFNAIVNGTPGILSSYVMSISTGINGTFTGCEIKLYFSNSSSIYLQFHTQKNSMISFSNFAEMFYPSYRTVVVSDFNDNDYYRSGYNDGYNVGVGSGETTGYDTGYNVGYNNGNLVGYQRGIEDSNQYTFLNLIGAVIDAPITAFVNLLDFEVFGFNMLNLCCSLLTLSLIILVVKFVLFRS